MDSSDLIFYTQTAFFVFIIIVVIFAAVIVVFRLTGDDKNDEPERKVFEPALNRSLADDYLKLKEERRRFLAIIDTVQEAIISIDHKGEIQTYNKAAEIMFGYKAEEVLRKRINILIPPAELGLHEGVLARHMELSDMDLVDIDRQILVYNSAGQATQMVVRISLDVIGANQFFICTIKKANKQN